VLQLLLPALTVNVFFHPLIVVCQMCGLESTQALERTRPHPSYL
jgi:hypothetical protein